MREIVDHRLNPAEEGITITAIDEAGAGGANHQYKVALPNGTVLVQINFQNGPIGEVGLNGLTHEILLAICADRLRSFQEGDFRCRENALALTKIEEAMNWFHFRTRNRIRRGVEGKNIR